MNIVYLKKKKNINSLHYKILFTKEKLLNYTCLRCKNICLIGSNKELNFVERIHLSMIGSFTKSVLLDVVWSGV